MTCGPLPRSLASTLSQPAHRPQPTKALHPAMLHYYHLFFCPPASTPFVLPFPFPWALSGPKPSSPPSFRSLPQTLAPAPTRGGFREGWWCSRALPQSVDVEQRCHLPSLLVVGDDRDSEAPHHGGECWGSQGGHAAGEEVRRARQHHQHHYGREVAGSKNNRRYFSQLQKYRSLGLSMPPETIINHPTIFWFPNTSIGG